MLHRQHGEFTTVDVSQEMGFLQIVHKDQHVLQTILPGTQFFTHLPAQMKGPKEVVLPVSRIITGLELLRMLGYPILSSDDCMEDDERFTDATCGHRTTYKEADITLHVHIVHTSHYTLYIHEQHALRRPRRKHIHRASGDGFIFGLHAVHVLEVASQGRDDAEDLLDTVMAVLKKH